MIECDGLIYYPTIPMDRFGRHELGGGGNRYRIIWAPSRKTVVARPFEPAQTVQVYGFGESGVIGREQGPKSIQALNARLSNEHKLSEVWILEQWKAPWDCYPGTREQYERDPMQLAAGIPYPVNGEYFGDETTAFHGAVPTLESAEKLILQIEYGWKVLTPTDKADAINKGMEKFKKDRHNTLKDMIDNRSLIGAGEAYSAPGRRNGRGTKTIVTDRYTTKDVGLAPGQFGSRRGPKRLFKVPL